ncbi:hypothetical protein AYO20_07320 [Fonsecaea nubica]|uniref:Uncharacterized protein n=1 Tax=Fonsecaea nubica TaxID=856822 RepID=A0A178CW36_9EURO|nr:hypothetical protein AYO20_07320 [Fonsecaea nubica]OAL33464.1 hypothetical protein AYO20_07320 [Fonsecaea nubica]
MVWPHITASLQSVSYRAFATKDSTSYPGPLLVTLKFNPRPEVALLAAAFDDGDLVVFDPYTQITRASIRESVAKMQGSNDAGRITLFAFETLQRLYCVDSYEMAVRNFAFGSNSESLLEVRGDHCKIWQPPILSQNVASNDMTSSLIDEDRSVTAPVVALERL